MDFKIRKIWIPIIYVFFFSVFLTSTVKAEGGKKVIKIGVIMPLTGGASQYGLPSLNAMNLAVKENSGLLESNKIEVKLIPEDSQARPSNGVSAFNKLTNIDGVKIVIGPLASSVTLAVAPLAEKNKVVLLSPSSSAPAISSSGDYIFRTELSDYVGGVAQATLAIDELKYRKVACVYTLTLHKFPLIEA